jgi:D-tagatose-1,6-bisphosphate aldolase subunit GatZ/KbaZ
MTSTPSSAAPASPLLDMVRAQKRGEARGIYSVCSANRFVLEASLLEAKADGSVVLIESTSNQVNPLGGYTGTTPAQFVTFVRGLAEGVGFPMERVILGGDHLGPFPHASEPAASALDKSREMVRQYVAAGYGKIHLDTSMRCADDPPGALADATVVERAAELCAVAEAARKDAPPGTPAPLYVVGTEVPTPGGEQETQDSLAVTRVEDAARTLRLSREAFAKRGLEDAWERVIALVVQPGVEFGDDVVFDYDRGRAAELRRFVEGEERIVFEAHSTDYQTETGLRQLVEDHFAILKVGPGLTFAFREAVFALAEIEREWLGGKRGVVLSDLRRVADEVMRKNPGYWQKYYHGDDEALRLARQFSLSDRIRYYWPQPEIDAALRRLLANLSEKEPPLTLLSQYLPRAHRALREGRVTADPRDLLRLAVLEVLEIYARACGMRPAVIAGRR